MSETSQEFRKEDAPKKYVAVVYHHVSYQNDEGVVTPGDARVSLREEGLCQLVKRRPDKKPIDVPDYFYLSVFSVVIFISMGLAAFVNSLKVRKAIKMEDAQMALDASSWALQHALSGIFLGPLFGCLLCLCIFLPMYQTHS